MSLDPDFSVRKLSVTDWEMLRDIRLRALQECEGMYLHSYQRALKSSAEQWKNVLSGDNQAIFCLMHVDTVIGLGSVFTSRDDPSGTCGVMAMGYIVPDYRGRGLSSLLYRARIDWALRHSVIKRLQISHRKGNEASRRAMLKHGFRAVGEKKTCFGDGVEDLDFLYEMDVSG